MAQAAELSADDFKFAGLRGGEMQRDVEARHEILLDAQLADVEGVADVLGMQSELDGTIDRDGQRADDDVVAGSDVIGWVEAKVVAAAVVNFIGMQAAELAVGAGIAEIKGKLFGLNVDVERVAVPAARCKWRPRLLSPRR